MFIKSALKATLLIFLFGCQTVVLAVDDFYNQSQKGWFWHEPTPEPEIEPEVKPDESPAATSTQTEERMVDIDAEWLKKNLPQLQANAINNPTTENLGAFYAAQRLMLDISSKFATNTSEFFRKEASWLSEDHRRPTEAFMLSRFKNDVQKAQEPVIEKISTQAGLWFFYSSACPYCVKQLPLINFLATRYQLNVLYVSLDGGTIPGIPEDKIVIDVDGRASSQFNVTVTPTTFLVSNDATKFELLSNGVSSLPKIQNALVDVAHKYNWITDAEFQSVQAVRGTNVLANGLLQVKESELSNPAFLYDVLQSRVDLTNSPIGTPLRIGAPN
ncbi:conjugal transfer protein TraF [Shewanella bicestrii]|uniref:conjugal transfer protein TraF n=1 Tax=Shewanella xiamenensis TaxID=332186 RepID=UPI00217D6F99|nr:conjugal transfer protein TraF [Shewanella xiamenensis]MCT8868986.1 conjugal transfer protein TraF [Shewanella xiamenensis]MCT8873671.1 conjugal transfer protein TraF [Shewanella xiamenensis]UWH39861.1 conjugal transfer protein TraF [Shewanella xiamenensis]